MMRKTWAVEGKEKGSEVGREQGRFERLYGAGQLRVEGRLQDEAGLLESLPSYKVVDAGNGRPIGVLFCHRQQPPNNSNSRCYPGAPVRLFCPRSQEGTP